MSLQNKDLLKCCVCYEQYDNSEHRPRTLPCHHFFCSLCIDNVINAKSTRCPTCRTPIGVTSASMLPANTLMEDLLQALNVSPPVFIEDFSAGSCPDHSNCKQYYKCKNHNINICRECTVLAHPTGICELISLKDELKENIKYQQQKVMVQITRLDNTIKVFQTDIYNENEENKKLHCELTELKEKVNNKLNDIERSEANMSKFNDAVQNIQKIQKHLHTVNNRLEIADTEIDMNTVCVEAEKINLEYNKLQFTHEKDLSAILKPNVKILEHLLQSSPMDILIIDEEDSVKRFSKLTLKDDQLCMPLLSKNLQTDNNSYKFKMSSVKHLITNSEVYLDLAKGENFIGTVYIQLSCNEYSKIFADLIIGKSSCSIIGKTRYFSYFKIWRAKHNSNASCKCHPSSVNGVNREQLKPGGVYFDGTGMMVLCPPQLDYDAYRIRIGTVIRGMDVVEAACCNEVAIVETGVVLSNPNY